MNRVGARLDMHTRDVPIIGCPMDHSSASFVYNHLFEGYGINTVMWPLCGGDREDCRKILMERLTQRRRLPTRA